MNKKQLEQIVSETLKEVLKSEVNEHLFDDEDEVKPADVIQVVDFLNSPENWLAAADAVSHARGKEEDLIDFVKIHEPFNRWSWKKVKGAIETADEKNMLGEFRTKRTIAEHILSVISEVVAEIDQGDLELHKDAAIEELKKKLKASNNPQLMAVFAVMAKKYRDKISLPKNLSVISSAINLAAKEGRWNELEQWFMDQTIKAGKGKTELHEFVCKK